METKTIISLLILMNIIYTWLMTNQPNMSHAAKCSQC